jgi:hypothetical protein
VIQRLPFALSVPVLALVLCSPLDARPAAAEPVACTADPHWTDPAWLEAHWPIAESCAAGDDCCFYRLAWQSFLYVVMGTDPPALATWPREDDVFTTLPPWTDDLERVKLPILGAIGKELQTGFDLPLYDQHGRLVEYEMHANRPELDFLVGHGLYRQDCFDRAVAAAQADPAAELHLPPGSVELKSAWVPRPGCDPARFGCGTDSEGDRVALIGLHVVLKTRDHQEWIWTTFEHIANAPSCDGSPLPAGYDAWTLNGSTEPVACTTPQPDGVNKHWYCREGSGICNCRTSSDDSDPVPTEVCREHPVDPTAEALNTSVEALFAGAGSRAVWGQYRLVGATWGNPGFDQPVPPDGTVTPAKQYATNTTMETYLQYLSPGRFACHTPMPDTKTRPGGHNGLDMSYFFNRIALATAAGDCPPGIGGAPGPMAAH